MPTVSCQWSIANGHSCKVRVHTKLKYLLTPSLLKHPNKTSINFNSQCDTLPNWMPKKQTEKDVTDLTDSDSDFRLQTDRFNRLLCTDSDFSLQTDFKDSDSDFRQILRHSSHTQALIRCLNNDSTVFISLFSRIS